MSKKPLTEKLRICRLRPRKAYAVLSLKTGGLCTPYVWNGPTAQLGTCLAIFARRRDAVEWCCNSMKHYRIAKVTIGESR